MKKTAVLVTAVVLFIAGSMVNPVLADEYQNTIDIFKKFHQSSSYFDNSYGFAVFPTIGKGAIGVGGAHGKRIIFIKSRSARITLGS